MTDKQIIREALKIARMQLFENDSILDNIPVDAGNFSSYSDVIPKLRIWRYFGKCNDRRVIYDVFGDATTMSNFVDSCTIINGNEAMRNIDVGDGERKLPRIFNNIYGTIANADEADDFNQIVFGFNDYQRIGFVYLVKTDTHYFFDCEM